MKLACGCPLLSPHPFSVGNARFPAVFLVRDEMPTPAGFPARARRVMPTLRSRFILKSRVRNTRGVPGPCLRIGQRRFAEELLTSPLCTSLAKPTRPTTDRKPEPVPYRRSRSSPIHASGRVISKSDGSLAPAPISRCPPIGAGAYPSVGCVRMFRPQKPTIHQRPSVSEAGVASHAAQLCVPPMVQMARPESAAGAAWAGAASKSAPSRR